MFLGALTEKILVLDGYVMEEEIAKCSTFISLHLIDEGGTHYLTIESVLSAISLLRLLVTLGMTGS